MKTIISTIVSILFVSAAASAQTTPAVPVTTAPPAATTAPAAPHDHHAMMQEMHAKVKADREAKWAKIQSSCTTEAAAHQCPTSGMEMIKCLHKNKKSATPAYSEACTTAMMDTEQLHHDKEEMHQERHAHHGKKDGAPTTPPPPESTETK